jgi:choline dehydrogenase-like flavoprotein
LKLTLSRAHDGNGRELILEGAKPGPRTVDAIARATRKLRHQRKATGAFPLERFLEIGAPGRGFHTGGSFPMRNNPSGFESDVLGRPCGFKRVHVVDSSVFPSIPATTITLSAMANARRIAGRHDEL